MSATSRISHVRDSDLLDEQDAPRRERSAGVGARRRLAGLAVAALGLPLLTLLLVGMRDTLSLESEVMIYLLAVVAVAVVGGIAAALVSAVAGAMLINYWFVAPLHSLDVTRGDQEISLVVFVIVAAVVSGAVELAARRARTAAQASAQADTLTRIAGGDLDETQTLRNVLDHAREIFGMETVVLKAHSPATGAWEDVEVAGWSPAGGEAPLRFDVPLGRHLRMIGRGQALFAEDRRILQAFAAAAQTAYEGRRLTAQARAGRDLATVDRQRTALLAAVGHDLRTPLAAIKVAVSTLRQTDVDWTAHERDALLATIEASTDRLSGVVGNLLDASRLQAGALSVHAAAVALDEVVAAAVLAVPDARDAVLVDVAEDLPPVLADRGLLERVLVNLLDNAVHHGAGDRPVEIRAYALSESAKIEVIDHGSGVAAAERERMFDAFARLDGHSAASGVGLGLAVARGFAEAMGGALVADDSPGSGLTMRLRLPLATGVASAAAAGAGPPSP
jgi:two-component system sensor histidine kinase KdpD